MKKIIVTLFLVGFVSAAFAGHYQIEKTTSAVAIDGATKSMHEKIDTDEITYNLVCLNEDSDYAKLKKSSINEFISETGQVHIISDLVIKYEKVLQVMSAPTFSLTGTEDVDVLYVLKKEGKTIAIDLYTGEDAHKMSNLLNTK